jgi:hypothetical protein
MSELVITNWFGDVISHPQAVVEANSVDDIIAVLKNPDKYPSPVRAVGSNHSTARCGVAEGGTLIKMKMNLILSIGTDTVTVEAGAVHIDIAHELEKHKLQFYVNTQIGTLSAGSAACAGTKDASMPGEYGQKVRSSYGTFGIIYEVTFQVRALTPMHVHHKTFHLQEFITKLPELKALNYSMMYYLFPFEDLITVEFRKYNPGATGEPNRSAWQLRNYLWGKSGPRFAHDIEVNISVPSIRYAVIDSFSAVWRFKLENIVAPEYFDFCKDYYQKNGYRANILNVGYRIMQDQKSLLSYSYDGPVMTIDPVSTANPGWKTFLAAYNQFCSDRGGFPLLNQTFGVTATIARKAFGDRLKAFEATRKSFDPKDRLLNDYFWDLLTGVPATATA